MQSEVDEEFLRRVYEQVARVPAGKVCTYGDIAKLAEYPGAAREVGIAVSRVTADMQLPCQRIVNAKGTLAPDWAFGGPGRQKAMLEAEGIIFFGNTIDLDRCRWPEPEGPVQQPLF